MTGATSHSGRRTFITKLATSGVSVRVIAEAVGHSSIATTQRYIDVNDEQFEDLMLGTLMDKVKTGKTVSKDSILKKLRS